MLAALPPEAAGLLALLALALLPGLLVVRAPWTVAPALSAAFWVLGWWWLPLGARSRVLAATLVLSAAFAVLRFLPKHTVPPPPGHVGPELSPPVTGPLTGRAPRLRSVPSLVVVGVGLALLVPLPLWPHAPGREMAFHTTATRLLVWRDALPASYEPLLPLPHFGSHAPGFPTLAADLSLLSGLDPGRSVVVAGLLTAGLLLIGLYGLLATRLRPWAAALGALLGLATAPWPRFLAVWGEGGPLLALALGLSAATLLMGHSSRPSAVAAGMLLGAGLLAQPVLTLGVGLAIAAGVAWEGKGRADMRRLALAGTVALVLAGPALVRLGRALSSREALGVLKAVQGREVMSFVTGLALVGLAGLLAHLLTQARPRSRVLPGVLVAVSAGILLVGAHAGPAAGQLEPAYLRSLARLEADARPLDAVCAGPEVLDWVPALGGRRPAHAGKETPEPWIPHPLRDEWSQAPGADCSKMLDPPAPRRSQPLTSGRGTPAEALRITH